MKNKLLLFVIGLLCCLGVSNVNAAASLKLTLACPSTAKTNTEITCVVYGSSTGSEVESVEDITAKPTGSLKRADYYIDYSIIPSGSQKNIGTISIQTGSTGTGQIQLVLDGVHFVDGSFQEQVTATKKITINKTGKSSSTNNSSSGTSTNSQTTTNNDTDSDTYLKGIKVSRGILSPSFSKNVYNYTVKVDSDVDKISIDGVKNNAGQKIDGEVDNASLNYGKNTFKLVVSNGSSSKRTYTVIVDRTDNRDTNALLSSISLSSGNIKFSSNTYEYETKVLYTVKSIDVIATAEKDTSTVSVVGANNLVVGENTITITVKAQKGNEQKYTIKVTRLAEGETIGDNANIKSIIISGYDLGFDYAKQDYKLVIKNETSLIIDIEMEDANATYQILGNSNLKDGSIIQIITKSYDGTASQTYNIEITKPKYSIYYVIAGVLASLAIATPIVFYFRYVKPKKELRDVNGNKIDKAPAEKKNYRKRLATTIPIGKNKKSKGKDKKEENKKVVAQPQATPQQQTPQPVQQMPQQVQQPEQPQVAPGVQIVSNIQEPTVQNMENSYNATNDVVNANQGINTVVNNQNVVNNDLSAENLMGSKCPKCERDLLGNPEVCPYCNTKLR